MTFARLLVTLSLSLIGSAAFDATLAQAYGQTFSFSSATALKMAQACIAYARARNAAVNIWIYNERGELLHFQRMDGAPPLGPSFNFGPQYGGGDPFVTGPGPVVAIPDTSATGGVPVVIDGTTVGSARAAGMGETGDLACAEAAAEAAKAP
jgi:uncharacterized protein GlcG (DUF336 family)